MWAIRRDSAGGGRYPVSPGSLHDGSTIGGVFDVGPGEFFTIAIIALLVFGPQRLPEIARKLGGYLAEIRRAAGDLRAGLDEEVRQLQAPLEEIKTDLTKPVTEIKSTFDETAGAITSEAEQAKRAAESELAAGPERPTEPSEGHEEAASANIEWIGPEPVTGPKPSEAWEGVDDPVPDSVAPVGPEQAADSAPAADEQAEGGDHGGQDELTA